MNPWLDRGLFCIVWVGCTWVAQEKQVFLQCYLVRLALR
jgi:hypothetical protein